MSQGAAVTLTSAGLQLVIRPDVGGAIQSLVTYDRSDAGALPTATIAVLRAAPAVINSARELASYPLVPFSNRIAQAQFDWDGVRYILEKHASKEPHAIHGVGWQRPWRIEALGERAATLSYEHAGDAAWPFAFTAQQVFELEDSRLNLSLSITNRHASALHDCVPVGLGWHPYFVKRSGARVRFEAGGYWAMGEDQLPTHREASRGLEAPLDPLRIDNCFDGWTGRAQLLDSQLCVTVTSALPCLVVYTKPELDSVALEPVSHVNNALRAPRDLQAQQGVRWLKEGETMNARMSIDVQIVRK